MNSVWNGTDNAVQCQLCLVFEVCMNSVWNGTDSAVQCQLCLVFARCQLHLRQTWTEREFLCQGHSKTSALCFSSLPGVMQRIRFLNGEIVTYLTLFIVCDSLEKLY